MKIDKEFLLKNQFWIGLGGAGVLVLGSIVVLFLGARPRAASAEANYIDIQKKLADQKDFKNQSFVTPWNGKCRRIMAR